MVITTKKGRISKDGSFESDCISHNTFNRLVESFYIHIPQLCFYIFMSPVCVNVHIRWFREMRQDIKITLSSNLHPVHLPVPAPFLHQFFHLSSHDFLYSTPTASCRHQVDIACHEPHHCASLDNMQYVCETPL
jgi:hypothetical protein